MWVNPLEQLEPTGSASIQYQPYVMQPKNRRLQAFQNELEAEANLMKEMIPEYKIPNGYAGALNQYRVDMQPHSYTPIDYGIDTLIGMNHRAVNEVSQANQTNWNTLAEGARISRKIGEKDGDRPRIPNNKNANTRPQPKKFQPKPAPSASRISTQVRVQERNKRPTPTPAPAVASTTPHKKASPAKMSGRRSILEQELDNERNALTAAQKALAKGRVLSTGQKADSTHQARVRQLESAVLDRQQNIQALQRELSRM